MPRAILRRDEAAMQGAAWTPALLQSDLAAWFDFSDPASLSWGPGISQVRSRNQRGATLDQVEPVRQPALARLNGRAAMRCAAGHLMASASAAALSNAFLVVSAGRIDGQVGSNPRFLSLAGAGSTADWNNPGSIALMFRNGANSIQTFQNSGARATTAVPDGQPFVFSVASTGATVEHFVNGAPGGSGSLSSPAIGAVRWLASAESVPPGLHSQIVGAMGEVVAIFGAQPAPVRHALEGYLAWRWGIPLRGDHRFANRPPVRGE